MEKNTGNQRNTGSQMKRSILIAAIAVVIVGALVALLLLLPKSEEDANVSPTESLEPTKTYYLINEQFTKLDSITICDGSGNRIHTVTATDTESGDRLYSISPSREGWDYDQDLLRSSAVNAATMSALSLVAENPSDLSEYGLDAPQWRIAVSFDGGQRKYEIVVGAPTALNNSYYCSNGDGNVYAIGAYSIGVLTRQEMDYRTYEFFPNYYDQSSLEVETDGSITYVRLLDAQNDFDMIVRQVQEGEFENPATGMYMESPIETFVSEDQAESKLINVAVLLTVNGLYLDDPTPEQLSECGFDTPLEMWLKNTDGDEVHYIIGTVVGSNAYVMVEGVNTILTAEQVYTSVFSLNYADIMFKMLLADNIKEVNGVDFLLPDGSRRSLALSYEEATDANPAGLISGSLDGVPMSSVNASRLYAAALNLNIYEAYKIGSVTLPASPALRVTVNRIDGGSHTLELYAINERRYGVKLDGVERGFYIHRDSVNALLNSFDYVDRGEEIPRVQ